LGGGVAHREREHPRRRETKKGKRESESQCHMTNKMNIGGYFRLYLSMSSRRFPYDRLAFCFFLLCSLRVRVKYAT
jgi:hypothetical protein